MLISWLTLSGRAQVFGVQKILCRQGKVFMFLFDNNNKNKYSILFWLNFVLKQKKKYYDELTGLKKRAHEAVEMAGADNHSTVSEFVLYYLKFLSCYYTLIYYCLFSFEFSFSKSHSNI